MILRLVLLFVSACAVIAPASRCGTWRAQWRADLVHYAQWLAVHDARARWRNAAALATRALGSLPHALVLRLSQWSLDMILHDVRFAGRMLLRRPAFTFVAAVDAAPLVALHGKTSSREDLSFSYLNFLDLRAAHPAGVEDVIAFRGLAMNLQADGEPRRVWGEMVT